MKSTSSRTLVKLKMKLFTILILPFLLTVMFSAVAGLHDFRGEVPTASFPLRLPKGSNLDSSKAGFKKVTYIRFDKASHPILPQPQCNPFSVILRNCNSAGHATVKYSTPTRYPVLAPKNVYLHNSIACIFTELPIEPMAYLTTTQPTTAPMTHSAPAPAHVTPSYDAATLPIYVPSQRLTYPTTTLRRHP